MKRIECKVLQLLKFRKRQLIKQEYMIYNIIFTKISQMFS